MLSFCMVLFVLDLVIPLDLHLLSYLINLFVFALICWLCWHYLYQSRSPNASSPYPPPWRLTRAWSVLSPRLCLGPAVPFMVRAVLVWLGNATLLLLLQALSLLPPPPRSLPCPSRLLPVSFPLTLQLDRSPLVLWPAFLPFVGVLSPSIAYVAHGLCCLGFRPYFAIVAPWISGASIACSVSIHHISCCALLTPLFP